MDFVVIIIITALINSKAVLLLWIIYVVSVLFLLCFRARLFIDAVVTCWERADLLALACDVLL